MDSKLLFALLGFSLLLLGCAGGQPQAPPAEQGAQPSQIDGVELGFDESQSLEDLDAVSGENVPQQLGDVDLSFNESESIQDIDALQN